jgi:hypothetical protein
MNWLFPDFAHDDICPICIEPLNTSVIIRVFLFLVLIRFFQISLNVLNWTVVINFAMTVLMNALCVPLMLHVPYVEHMFSNIDIINEIFNYSSKCSDLVSNLS